MTALVKPLRRLLPALLLAVASLADAAPRAAVKAPDFAFPKQVERQAARSYARAVKEGDGPGALRALLDGDLAVTAVNPDSLTAALARLAAARAQLRSATFGAMACMAEAQALGQVYASERWTYDSRLAPGPADNVALWSAAQLRGRVDQLIDSALMAAGPLQRTPIGEYASCLTLDPNTDALYPTLFDAVTAVGIDALGNFGTSAQTVARQRELARLRLDAAARGTAPWLSARLALADLDGDHGVADWLQIYSEGADAGPWQALALDGIDLSQADAAQLGELYALTGAFLDEWPSAPLAGCVANLRQRMAQPRLDISYPRFAEPGAAVDVKVGMSNVASGAVCLYRVDAGPDDRNYTFAPERPPRQVAVAEVGCPARAVPWEADTVVSFTLPEAGAYIVLPLYDSVHTPEESTVELLRATTLALACGGIDGLDLWSLDARDGHPVGDVDILDVGSRNKPESVGRTSADGSLRLKESPQRGSRSLVGRLGKDDCSGRLWVWNGGEGTRTEERTDVKVWTALPLCRPGDDMGWMAAAWKATRRGCTPDAGARYTATLYDANGQAVDTLHVSTDRFGRAAGTFAVPAAGALTGDYRIALRRDDNGRASGSAFFTVSDYKLPTFDVADFRAERDTPVRGAVTFTGRAVTYSGFPLAGAQAEVTLSNTQGGWWHRASAPTPFWSGSAVTGADGRFSLTVYAAEMDNAPWPRGTFTAKAKVTSPTMESQWATAWFTRGPRLRLWCDVPAALDADAPAFTLKAVNPEGSEESGVAVSYEWLDGDGRRVASGTTVTGTAVSLGITGLPTGRYELVATLADDPDDEPAVRASTVVYRPSQSASPVAAPLWTPETALEAVAGGRPATLAVWTPRSLWARYALCAEGRVVDERWLELPAGRSDIAVGLPAGVANATLTLAAVADYASTTLTLPVADASLQPRLTLTTESFRDRAVPGAPVTWRFRLRPEGPDSGNAAGALALTLYNEALDALRPMTWDLRPSPLPSPSFDWSVTDLSGRASDSSAASFDWKDCSPVATPDFNLYGRYWCEPSFDRLPHRMVRGSRMKGTEEAMLSASPVASMAVNDMADGLAETEAEAGSADAGDVDEAAPDTPFAYRDREVALALFRPMLTTNADGTATVSFTMPDANTTWLLQALAWTPAMTAARLDARVVASKPLMVQPGLPRFLRAGDRCRVEALVINNDSTACRAEGLVEVALADGTVVVSHPFALSLAPMQALTVSTALDVPSEGVSLLVYRIKATAGRFTDGEQALLPVLPSVQPVLEVTPFWADPSSRVVTVEVPAEAEGAESVTLDATENPVWDVVAALPGIQAEGVLTAPQAARSLFATCVAEGILRTRPAVAKALRRWTATPEGSRDSLLVASLSRNSELKELMLQATPWVGDAASDAERLDRLSLLFDRRAVEGSREQAVKALAALSRPDGGWSWCGGSDEPSEWATTQTLLTLGRLNAMGFLPDDRRLADMTGRALRWLDGRVAEQYRRSPGGNYTVYTWLRGLWPDVRQSSAAAAVSSATVQQLTGRWRDLPVAPKAVAAMILENANYHATARLVLESLREYAETSPEKGMWWPSLRDEGCWCSLGPVGATALCLEAFSLTEPGCADIDRLRQWLIVQKQCLDWGSGADASAAVAAVLLTSPRWTEPAAGMAVEVDGRPVEAGAAQTISRAAGQLRVSLTGWRPGATVAIVKPVDSPMAGALYVRRNVDLAADSLAAQGSPEMSVEKRMWVIEGGEAREIPADGVEVGATVRIEFTIVNGQAADYVALTDERAACWEPCQQLPATVVQDGLVMRRENLDATTHLFLRRLPAGQWRLWYDVTATNAGTFASGSATVQSQYNPALTAHSSAAPVTVR